MSVEKAVDRCATALVALDEFAAQRIDAAKESLAFCRTLAFECGEGGLERTQFAIVKVGEIGEMQSITNVGEFHHSRMVGAHGGVTRWSRRSGPLLLAENGSEFTRRSTCMRPRIAAGALLAHDVEPALRDTSHERHDVFLFLQRRAQRAQSTE